MAIQNIFNDVKARVDSAQKPYREAFQAYVKAQKKAFDVVSNSAQSLAKTESEAAKDVFAAARASFDKARKDGVRQIASQPQAYLPEGRDRIVSAYQSTIDVLVKTGNDLGDVVTKGYKDVVNKLTGKPGSQRKSSTAGKKATSGKSTASKSGTAKSTASKANGTKSTATKAAGSKTATARKTATKRPTGTSKKSTGGGSSTSTATSSS